MYAGARESLGQICRLNGGRQLHTGGDRRGNYPMMCPQNGFILELLEFALSQNFFQYGARYYQQTRGTPIGPPWAPAYACLHLSHWEEWVVYHSSMFLGQVSLWLRYIDDVLYGVDWKHS